MLRHMASGVEEDFSQPILPGEGPSDYERYLRTDELLALQKTPEERIHRDELLFQTVHQSSELWLKHACAEVATGPARGALRHRPARDARAALAVGVPDRPACPRARLRLRLSGHARGAAG